MMSSCKAATKLTRAYDLVSNEVESYTSASKSSNNVVRTNHQMIM